MGIKGKHSEWKLIPAGVLQASVLRPLLFMVYTIYLVDNIHALALSIKLSACAAPRTESGTSADVDARG